MAAGAVLEEVLTPRRRAPGIPSSPDLFSSASLDGDCSSPFGRPPRHPIFRGFPSFVRGPPVRFALGQSRSRGGVPGRFFRVVAVDVWWVVSTPLFSLPSTSFRRARAFSVLLLLDSF